MDLVVGVLRVSMDLVVRLVVDLVLGLGANLGANLSVNLGVNPALGHLAVLRSDGRWWRQRSDGHLVGGGQRGHGACGPAAQQIDLRVERLDDGLSA